MPHTKKCSNSPRNHLQYLYHILRRFRELSAEPTAKIFTSICANVQTASSKIYGSSVVILWVFTVHRGCILKIPRMWRNFHHQTIQDQSADPSVFTMPPKVFTFPPILRDFALISRSPRSSTLVSSSLVQWRTSVSACGTSIPVSGYNNAMAIEMIPPRSTHFLFRATRPCRALALHCLHCRQQHCRKNAPCG